MHPPPVAVPAEGATSAEAFGVVAPPPAEVPTVPAPEPALTDPAPTGGLTRTLDTAPTSPLAAEATQLDRLTPKPSWEAAMENRDTASRVLKEAAETPTTIEQFQGQYETVQPILAAADNNRDAAGRALSNIGREMEGRRFYDIAEPSSRFIATTGYLRRQAEALLTVNGVDESGIGEELAKRLNERGSRGMHVASTLEQAAHLDFPPPGVRPSEFVGTLEADIEDAQAYFSALNAVVVELSTSTAQKMQKDIIGLQGLDDFQKAAYLAAVRNGTEALNLGEFAGKFADYLRQKDQAMKAAPDAPVFVQFIDRDDRNYLHSVMLPNAGEGLGFTFDPASGESSVVVGGGTGIEYRKVVEAGWTVHRPFSTTGPVDLQTDQVLDQLESNGFKDPKFRWSINPILVGAEIASQVAREFEDERKQDSHRSTSAFHATEIEAAEDLGITDRVFVGEAGAKLLSDIAAYNESLPPRSGYSGADY